MTRHVTVTLTEREAEQIVSGAPDARAWKSVQRKCNYELHEMKRREMDEMEMKS